MKIPFPPTSLLTLYWFFFFLMCASLTLIYHCFGLRFPDNKLCRIFFLIPFDHLYIFFEEVAVYHFPSIFVTSFSKMTHRKIKFLIPDITSDIQMTRIDPRKKDFRASVLTCIPHSLQLKSLELSLYKVTFVSCTERKRSQLNVTAFNHFNDSLLHSYF